MGVEITPNFTAVNNFDVAESLFARFYLYIRPVSLFPMENGRTTFRLLPLLTFHFCRISFRLRCVL